MNRFAEPGISVGPMATLGVLPPGASPLCLARLRSSMLHGVSATDFVRLLVGVFWIYAGRRHHPERSAAVDLMGQVLAFSRRDDWATRQMKKLARGFEPRTC